MASKNYRYLKDGSKNPNYKPATAKKTSNASTNRPAAAKKTSAGSSKVYRYDKQGKLKNASAVPAVDRNPQEEKEKVQLPKLKAWGNAVKDFLTGGRDVNEAASVKSGNDFDAQFTEDFFNNNDRAKYLVEKGIDGTTAQEKAEFVIMDRMLQAGVTNRSKVGGDDNRYKTSDEVYDVNNTVNQGANQIWMDAFYKQATEDDIRAVIGNWQQMIDLAPEGSDFKRRAQADLDSLKDYAKNNFSSFANEAIRSLGDDISATKAEMERRSTTYNADLLAAANDALEASRSGGYNLYDYVNNRPELREAVGFDDLEAQYEDPDDFNDALRSKLETISGAETAMQDNTFENEQVLGRRLTEQQHELENLTGIYTNLLKKDKFDQVGEDAAALEAGYAFEKSVAAYDPGKWVQDTVTGINGDKVVTDVRFDANKATLDQIVKNPAVVREANNGLEMPDADTDYKAALAAEMLPEEKEKYWALRAGVDGEARSAEYFDWLTKNELSRRNYERQLAATEVKARMHPILASAASLGTNVLGAIGGTADTLRGMFGMEVDQYGPNQMYTRKTQEIRETVGEEIAKRWDWTIPGLNVNAGALIYNTVMSMGDMAVAIGIGGGVGGGAGTNAGKALTQIIMSSEAAAGALTDAIDRGIDPQTGAWEAVAAGLIEGFTEKYSLDALFKDVTPDSLKSTIKYIAQNALTEGTEEIAADFLNDAVDILMNTSDAELWEKYTDYVNNGYDSNGALTRLFGEALSEYGVSGVAGAATGGVMAGGNVAVQTAQQNAEYRSLGQRIIDNGNASAVIRAGLASADAKIRNLAKRLSDKISEIGLPQDSETAAEVQVVAESEGIDANGQKVETAVEAPEEKPTLEIKQPEGNAVDAQKPAEQASIRAEEAPAEEIAEETGSSSASEGTPELAWNKETAAPADKKPAAKVETEAVKEAFKGSAKKLGKLYTKVMKALDVDISTKGVADMTGRIKARLKQLGEETIDPIAEAIAKLVTGEKPTQDQLDLLEGNTLREGVLNEVTRSIIRNGGSEFLSDATQNQITTRTALQQATTQKGVQLPDTKKAAAPQEKVQAIVEETVAADKEGTIQARANMLGNEEAAQTMINMAEGVTNTRAYAAAFEDAYDFGTAGIDENVARTSALTTALTPEQFKAAYQAGVKAAAAPVRAAKTGGKVTFAGNLGSRLNEMNPNQMAGIRALRQIASIGTVNIEFFQSEANDEGKYIAENGSYDPKTNTIRIDVNAGRNNVRSANNFALLRVAGHELTHYIKAHNAEGYKALQDFVVKQLTATGGNSFDALVANKMVQQPDLSYAAAVEEVVADGCEMMLKDSTAIQQLAQENKGLFRRIRNWLRSFIANVKRAFRGVEATSAEAQMIKNLEGLQKLWDDALVQASRNVQQSAAEALHMSTETQQAIENDQAVDAEAEVKHSIRLDEEYQNAYDDYDEERAREIIQEAAIAAGYSPLKLYHGTDSFGFTKIDPSKADDVISFFTSTDEKVSQTYVGRDASVRRISDKDVINVDRLTNADGKTLLPLLRKYYSDSVQLVSEEEVRELVGDEGELIRKRIIPKVEELRELARIGFEEWPIDPENENATLEAYDAIIDALDRLSYAKNYDMVDRLHDAYYDALAKLRDLDELASSTVALSIGEDLRQRVARMQEYLDGAMFKVEDEWSTEYINTNQAINFLAPKVLNGIYELYGKTDNLLEIDGKGANWNRLDGGFLLGKTYATTRDFAEYAKEMGFDGVHFKNIHDVGGLANYNAASDIYTFFNPSDVKSADPFTFDDDGNLIMPSERFNRSNDDIRYSVRETTDGHKVVVVEDDILDGIYDTGKWTSEQKSKAKKAARKALKTAGPIYSGGIPIYIDADTREEFPSSNYVRKTLGKEKQVLADRYRIASEAEDMLIATPKWERDPLKKPRKDFVRFIQGQVYMSIHGRNYIGTVKVGVKTNGGYVLYDLVDMENASFEIKKEGISSAAQAKKAIAPSSELPSNGGIIAQNRSYDKMFSIRTTSKSDREILADAFENVASNDTERSFLKNYRDKIASLQQKQEQLRKINKDITDRKANAARTPNGRIVYDEELIKQQNRAKILRAQIDREDNAIIEMIKSKPLQDVLRRQKQRIEKQEAGKRKEAIAAIRDRRNATEVRHKIKAVLDDFNRRLKNPTEKSYIPANMVQLVIAAEELIDTRSGREGEKAQAKLAALQGMYERYKSDATFAYVYDPVIADMLGSLSSVVGNKSIYQLNSAELQSVYETLKALKKQVTEAVQLKAGNYARTIIEAGREMIRETAAAAPLAKGKVGEFLNWQLTPDKFFARLAGFKKNSIWSKVAESFSKGTEKMLEIQRDHYYHFKRFTESKEFDKLNDQKHLVDIGLTNDKGETVKVTRGMMLSAYMHLLNEENARGFMYGGFSIPNLKAYYNGKVKESYGRGSANTRGTAQELYELAQQMNDPSLTEEQLAALEAKHDQLIMEGMNRLEKMRSDIYNQMTQYEKDLVEAVRAWNDGKSQQYINDVTMDLYGIKKASVQNYFPIHRDTAFVNTDFASISRNVNLENWGSLKTRVPSQAPILLTDIAYEMDSSLNQMSRYVGYAKAQRDFNKLYNVRMPGMSGSVKKAVSVKFGTGAGLLGVSGEQYIENYIGSITGSRQGQSGPLSLIRRNLVRSTMTLNLRVGFSQLSAIPKAAAEVGWDSMTKGLFGGGVKAIFSKSAREELARQNAWFWQRYRGEGGQREFADAKGGTDIISKLWNGLDDITRGKLLNWCQNFDVMSTVTMWSMAKAWARKHTNYAEGSAEFLEAANQKYTDILRNTQAMSTTTERSDASRNSSDGWNLFMMFKSEAFANFNLLYDAVAKLRKYNADFKAGANDVTKADVNAAKRHLAGAATSVIIGASLGNALLKLLINALTHAMDGYRDDEDEITFESTLTAIGKEVASDAAGMVLLGGELYEFISAVVLKDKYYAPTDMALGEVTELLETIIKVTQDEDSTAEDYLNAAKKVTFNLTNIMGVPAENVKRYWKGASAWLEEAQDGTLGSWEGGLTRTNSMNYDRLYNAAIAGDDEKFGRVLVELEGNGKDEKGALEEFRTRIKKAYQGGELTEAEATDMLVTYGGKDNDEAFWTMDEWNYNGEGNYSRYADLRTAMKESNASVAKAEIQKLTSHGVEEKTVIGELSTMYNKGEATTILNLQLRSNNLYTSDLKLKTDKEVHKDDFDAFLTAVVNGSGVSNEISRLKQKGYTTKQIMSALNKAFGNDGKRYRRMEYYNPTEARILLDRILKAYEALGLNRNEEIAWINENWEKFVPEDA